MELNVRQAERRLRELLERKPDITQPGRLLEHLVNELGVASDTAKTNVNAIRMALERMEANGEVELERAGSVLNAVRSVGSKKPSSGGASGDPI